MKLEEGYKSENCLYAVLRPGEELTPEKELEAQAEANRRALGWLEYYVGTEWFQTWFFVADKWVKIKTSVDSNRRPM